MGAFKQSMIKHQDILIRAQAFLDPDYERYFDRMQQANKIPLSYEQWKQVKSN